MKFYQLEDFQKIEKYIDDEGFIVEKHPSENLFIYGYPTNKQRPRNWDDFNVNLRGLVLDDRGNVIARGFPKFFTFKGYLGSKFKILSSDNQVITVPKSYKIFEKIDGSLCILYWIDNKPFLASQRSFVGKKVQIANQLFSCKYSHIFKKLNRDYTYLFELISPQTRVLVNYGNEIDLILIGIIDNRTGNSIDLQDIGFRIPYEYTNDLKNFNDFNKLQSLNLYNKEGFVIHFENSFKLKIKFDWYKEAHSLIDELLRVEKIQQTIIHRLKSFYNLDPNPLTNVSLFHQFNKGKTIYEIYQRIPPMYFHLGVEEWIEKVYKDFLSKKKLQSKNSQIEPDNVYHFHPHVSEETTFDSTMWNFANRIIEMYE